MGISASLLTHKYYNNIILYRITNTKFFIYVGSFEQFINDFKIIKDKYYNHLEMTSEEITKDLVDTKLITFIPDAIEFIEYFRSKYSTVYNINKADIPVEGRTITGYELCIINRNRDLNLNQISVEDSLTIIETEWRAKYNSISVTY